MKFWIPGKPQGKARARTVNNGGRVHSFTPEKTVLYENLIKVCFEQAKPADWEPLNSLVEMTIRAVFPVPKSYSKKRREWCLKGYELPCVKPDCDNIAKVICDALNGFAYVDDKQIVKLVVTKEYGEEPGVEVTL
jgi:Holliday junction resolvase RusA-like endonuclease